MITKEELLEEIASLEDTDLLLNIIIYKVEDLGYELEEIPKLDWVNNISKEERNLYIAYRLMKGTDDIEAVYKINLFEDSVNSLIHDDKFIEYAKNSSADIHSLYNDITSKGIDATKAILESLAYLQSLINKEALSAVDNHLELSTELRRELTRNEAKEKPNYIKVALGIYAEHLYNEKAIKSQREIKSTDEAIVINKFICEFSAINYADKKNELQKLNKNATREGKQPIKWTQYNKALSDILYIRLRTVSKKSKRLERIADHTVELLSKDTFNQASNEESSPFLYDDSIRPDRIRP